MTSHGTNPFRPTRWEQQRDGHQLIWFSPVGDRLGGDKSVYVRGSRGSGKTTLLKSICWEDLLDNESLKSQRKITDVSHIGVYIRIPDHLSNTIIVEKNQDVDIIRFHTVFTAIIEFSCIDKCLEACHMLRLRGIIELKPMQELKIVSNIISEYPSLIETSHPPPRTFLDLSRALRFLVRDLTEIGTLETLSQMAASLPRRAPGDFIHFVCTLLSTNLRYATERRRDRIAFKFCLDDCESLTALHQKSLNTLVRISRFPITWVISAVGAFFDITETMIGQQPLTSADREVVSLDARKEEDFRNLCQAVLSLRLFAAADSEERLNSPSDDRPSFSLNARLGRRTVNDVIGLMIQRSTSTLARDIDLQAQQLREALRAQRIQEDDSMRPQSDTLPFYEGYILNLWRGSHDAFATKFDLRNASRVVALAPSFRQSAFRAWLRRKQRGALLHMASTLGFRRLPLGGANIIVSISDGSIRDFLEIMGYVYAQYAASIRPAVSDNVSLKRFSNSRSQISWQTQTNGIYDASESYFDGVSARAARGSDAIQRVIEGLGYYTALLQSRADDPTALGRTERGIFVLRFQSPSITQSRDARVWRLIRQAEIAGYIRVTDSPGSDRERSKAAGDDTGRSLTFRLHRRFAPRFGFSYRGAYEAVGLSPSDLWPLCSAEAPMAPRLWAENLARKAEKLTKVASRSEDSQIKLGFVVDDDC
jgi:hypothetical protein